MKEGKLDEILKIAGLIKKLHEGKLSISESEQLDEWLQQNEGNRQLFASLTDAQALKNELLRLEKEDVDAHAARIFQKAGIPLPNEDTPEATTVHRMPHAYKWMAAAAVTLFAIAGLWFFAQKNQHVTVKPLAVHSGNKIVPGGNKAVLTLADGSQVVLSDSAKAVISLQGNTTISKPSNGSLVYNETQSTQNSQPLYNTMTTPRGGKYELVLADGTHVWLNAASSLTYPVAFNGKERRVSVTGEAYFEVAKSQIPFSVQLPDSSVVQVLGTHFNINAYSNETKTRTTLLEGSIKVSKANKDQLISPGQQYESDARGKTRVISNVDVNQIIAWKNGYFVFDKTDLQTLMRQLERWYDIEVQYPTGVNKQYQFVGEIERSADLSKVLRILQLSGVHFSVEGRRLLVEE